MWYNVWYTYNKLSWIQIHTKRTLVSTTHDIPAHHPQSICSYVRTYIRVYVRTTHMKCLEMSLTPLCHTHCSSVLSHAISNIKSTYIRDKSAPDWPKSTLAILVLPLVGWPWLSQTLQLSSVTVKSVILTLWRHTPYSAVCNTKWTLTMKVQKWHFATEIHTVSQTHPHNYRDRGIYASGVAMVMRIQASFPSHLLHTAHSITSDKVCMPSSTCTVCLSGCLCLAKGRCVQVNCSRGINSRINQYQLTTGTFWPHRPLSNVYKRFVCSWQRSTLSTHPVVSCYWLILLCICTYAQNQFSQSSIKNEPLSYQWIEEWLPGHMHTPQDCTGVAGAAKHGMNSKFHT